MTATKTELIDALSELVAEWDNAHQHEDHRTGYTADTGGIETARLLLANSHENPYPPHGDHMLAGLEAEDATIKAGNLWD